MILVKFDDNWADEMDVSGFKLYDNIDAWNAAIAKFKEKRKIDEENYFEVYFGTNEWIEYDSLDEFLNNFKVIEISDTDAAVIGAMFPEANSCGYAHFPI